MSRDERLRLLRSLRPLERLDPSVLSWLADSTTEIAFAPGDELTAQGGSDRDCFFIVDGDVGIVVNTRRVGTCGPGDTVGDGGLLYKTDRMATSLALSSVRALHLRADDFDQLAREKPHAAQQIADAIIGRIEVRLGRRPPPWRPDTG